MSDELIDQRLGQYLITEVIARGGMATVYKATQPSLDRVVAIKVLRHDADPQFIARFKREARATAALQHHNILPIHDYNDQNGLLYLVLQYVEDGRTLGGMLKPMATVTALQLMSHIFDALDYAHKRGIIHRDIKPTNILMPSPTWPMLADFGIAKLMNGTQLQLTLSNQVIGTAIYLAPEQVMGRSVDARTDLYSAGVVLYELVTGRVPFDGDTPMEVWNKHVYETPPSPRRLNPDLPAPLETLLLRALAKNPNERYQSVTEMAAELSRIANDLDHDKNRSQITGLYEVGVQAFEQGQWEQAVDRLGKLIALDPGYEDASELLEAAREAQERARTEARQQIELVRQRRQSGIQQPIRPAPDSSMAVPAADAATRSPVTDTTTLSPATPAASPPAPAPRSPVTDATMLAPAIPAPRTRAPATVKLPALDEPPLPTTPPLAPRPLDEAARAAVEAPAGASTPPLVDAAAAKSAAPAGPPATSGRRLPIAWIVAAVVALVLLLALLFILRGGGQPNPSGTATTAAQNTPADAFTTVPAAAALTTAPTAAGPSTAATAPTARAALPAPAGVLAYADDFSAGAAKSGLVGSLRAPDLALAVDPPGVYAMRLAAPNQTRWVFLPRLAVGDFSVLIDLADRSPDRTGGAAQGLVFRGRDSAHFYALLIDPRTAAYRLRKQDGKDSWTDLIAPTPSALIQPDGVNQLRLDATGDSFTLSVNGVALDRARDRSYTFGMLGMLIANADARASTMHFDNLQIWSTDPPPRPATLPATRQSLSGDMVLIPGGEFVLGSNDNPADLPQIVAQPAFYIDAKEVTNGAYLDCADRYGCSLPNPLDSATHPGYATAPQFIDHPVVNVSWQQAAFFCAQHDKHLPSEAEWEKAASWSAANHTKAIWPWGDVFDAGRLNSAAGGRGDAVAVATFPSNPNGTFDMAGNVAEWTQSLYKPYPYDPADGREDPQAGGERVVRGGAWAQPQAAVSTDHRQAAAPDTASTTIGFRCAATPQSKTQ